MGRGSAHIEVIISFILFMGFLIFGLYFFNPLDTTRVLDSTLYYAHDEILKNFSTTVYTYGMSIRPAEAGDDFIVATLKLDDFGLNVSSFRGVRIEDSAGEEVSLYYDNRTRTIYFSKGVRDFFRFTFGDLTTHQNRDLLVQGYETLLPERYVISSTDVRGVYSERAALVLRNRYTANYAPLKEELNLPRRVDFDFVMRVGDRVIVEATQPIPEQVEIYAKQQRIEIIGNSSGLLEFAELGVRVW